MLVNFKSVFLFSLVAVSQAQSIVGSPDLSTRAPVIAHECDGEEISQEDIYNAWNAGKGKDEYEVGNRMPKYFGNEGKDADGNGNRVFPNIPDSTALLEFPIVKGGTYSRGNTGKLRAVFKYGKENKNGQYVGQSFVGVMKHGSGNSYYACKPKAADPEPPTPPAPPAPPAPPGPPLRRAVRVEY